MYILANMRPSFSVIIPCYNEQNYLGNLLNNLVSQTIKPSEVIVSDCQSEDKTLEVAKSYRDKLPIKITTSRFRSAAAARNTGAKIAKGRYLIFIDADMAIPPTFMEKISRTLERYPVDFLTPKYQSDRQHVLINFLAWFTNKVIWLNSSILDRAFGIGGVMCVHKDIHIKIGGFDSKKSTRDDIDYVKKLQKVSVSYLYLSSLSVTISSRRLVKGSKADNFFQILHFTTRKFGNKKRFGHYDE